MNAIRWFPVVALAAALAAAGCNKAGKLSEKSKQPPPTGPVELKLKWTPNERVVQNLDMKTKTEMSVPGQPAPIQQNITMGQKFALTVLQEMPDGGHEVEMEYLGARMGVEQGGKTVMDYDSTRKSADEKKNPVADMFGKIIGAKIHFFLDASNNVERIEGVDELMNRMATGRQASDLAPLKSMFSEGYFKQMMSSSLYLPPKPVAPGDSWPVRLEIPMDPLGTLVLDYTFTLERWEMHGKRNCARMEFQGTIETKPGPDASAMGMTMALHDGTTSGVSWFDPELGITIDSLIHQDLTMTMSFPKNPRPKPGTPVQMQTITNQMSQVLNVKLDSVK